MVDGGGLPQPPALQDFIVPREVEHTKQQIEEGAPVIHQGALALDLKLGFFTVEEIASKYKCSVDDIIAIRRTPQFVREYADVERLLTTPDKNKGFLTRTRYMVEQMLPEVLQIFRDPLTPAKERIAIFDKLVTYAKLDPTLEKSAAPATQVNISISGDIRGLSDTVKIIDG